MIAKSDIDGLLYPVISGVVLKVVVLILIKFAKLSFFGLISITSSVLSLLLTAAVAIKTFKTPLDHDLKSHSHSHSYSQSPYDFTYDPHSKFHYVIRNHK